MRRFLQGTVAVALLYCGWVLASRVMERGSPGVQPTQHAESASGQHAKILAFYARDGMVSEGGATVICYGVSNARSVRIDPPIDGVSPSLNRCLEVRPKGVTRYTLTAEGSDGKTVSDSFTIHVGVDPMTLPRITSFRIEGRQKDYSGQTIFTLSFGDQNADEVSITPPVFPPLHGAPSGQFYVMPDKTTTYTLTVKSKNGHVARQQLTVDVP